MVSDASSMDAQDDGLHDDEEHGDAGGGAARGDSCLNMNPMHIALRRPSTAGAGRAGRPTAPVDPR